MDLLSFDIDELLGMGDDSNPLMMLVWILPIILFVFYGQRIQLMVTSGEIRKGIKRLDAYGSESRDELVAYVRKVIGGAAVGGRGGGAGSGPDAGSCGGSADGLAGQIDTLLDYFTIMPADMDPSGIVPKIEQVVRSREDYTRRHVKLLCPGIGDGELSRVQTLLEIATVLRLLHRTVNHMYLTAKKQKNFPLILPLQMALPFVMEQAAAMRGQFLPSRPASRSETASGRWSSAR